VAVESNQPLPIFLQHTNPLTQGAGTVPINSDEQYRIYNFGIEEGREIVRSYLDGEDVIDVILEAFDTKRQVKRIEDSTIDELKLAVSNFHDGVEDGIKSQLQRESTSYIKWLLENEE
jgi:hypothetical protein